MSNALVVSFLLAAGPVIVPPTTSPSAQVRPTPVSPPQAPPPVVYAPIVVPTPRPAATGRTWVPGRYVDQTLPNGQSVRIWVPGYWT